MIILYTNVGIALNIIAINSLFTCNFSNRSTDGSQCRDDLDSKTSSLYVIIINIFYTKLFKLVVNKLFCNLQLNLSSNLNKKILNCIYKYYQVHNLSVAYS